MRAVVHDRYGPPEVLRLEDVPRPVPKDDQLLVRVHATTVNRTDTGLRAEYLAMRETGPIAPIPAGIGFDEAAAVTDGASLVREGGRPAPRATAGVG